jgi:hypothetical protein
MRLIEISSFESWFAGSKVVDKHGRPPCWVSTSYTVAERFVDFHRHETKGRRRVIQYEITRPLTLLKITGRHSLNDLEEYYGVETRDPYQMAEDVCRLRDKNGNRFDGWIIPNNYPDGDDIMLAESNVLSHVKTRNPRPKQ